MTIATVVPCLICQQPLSMRLAKGRKSEVDYLNGLVASKGLQAGVATPVNRATVEVMHDIDDGRIKPDPSNLQRLLRAGGMEP